MIDSNGEAQLAPDSKFKFSGFWSKLEFKGSCMPTCRENATMVAINKDGQSKLLVFGGSNPKIGISSFEAFTFSLDKRTWHPLNLQTNIMEQKGTRPVIG